MLGQEHCDYEYIVQSVGEQNDVYITVDGKFVAIARYINGKKATYAAKINLINFLEGRHIIKALFPKEIITKTDKVPESVPVDFVVDNTPPLIRSVFLSNIVRLKDTDISNPVVEAEGAHPDIDVNKCSVVFDLCLIVEAVDVCSGIDVDNCTASLDGKFLGMPTVHKNGVVFPLVNELEAVSHKLKVIIQDRAGNKAEYESAIVIDSLTSLISDVIVETARPVSELDLQRCGISIDGQPPYPPSYETNCLVFPLEMKLKDMGTGQHKITISIFDIAGRVTEYKSEFFVDRKESIKGESDAAIVSGKKANLIPSNDIKSGKKVRKSGGDLPGTEVDKVGKDSGFVTEGRGVATGKKAVLPPPPRRIGENVSNCKRSERT